MPLSKSVIYLLTASIFFIGTYLIFKQFLYGFTPYLQGATSSALIIWLASNREKKKKDKSDSSLIFFLAVGLFGAGLGMLLTGLIGAVWTSSILNNIFPIRLP
jgi:hypothetical protein